MKNLPEVFVSFDPRKTILYITKILKNSDGIILVSNKEREGQTKHILNTFCNDLGILKKEKRWKEEDSIKIRLMKIGITEE